MEENKIMKKKNTCTMIKTCFLRSIDEISRATTITKNSRSKSNNKLRKKIRCSEVHHERNMRFHAKTKW